MVDDEDNGRVYTGVDIAFNKDHRAHAIERGQLTIMRMRSHTLACQMAYDMCYEPFFKCVELLQVVLQFKRVPPVMNHPTLTSLLDHWRPETHNFHLPCGEMNVTLKDFAMITRLPIDGHTLTERVDKKNWRHRVISLIGDCSTFLSE